MDYFICEDCHVILGPENKTVHKGHFIVGEFYKIKYRKTRTNGGFISQSIIRKELETLNIKRSEKREFVKKKKIKLAQERYDQQLKSGEIIVNLLGVMN